MQKTMEANKIVPTTRFKETHGTVQVGMPTKSPGSLHLSRVPSMSPNRITPQQQWSPALGPTKTDLSVSALTTSAASPPPPYIFQNSQQHLSSQSPLQQPTSLPHYSTSRDNILYSTTSEHRRLTTSSMTAGAHAQPSKNVMPVRIGPAHRTPPPPTTRNEPTRTPLPGHVPRIRLGRKSVSDSPSPRRRKRRKRRPRDKRIRSHSRSPSTPQTPPTQSGASDSIINGSRVKRRRSRRRQRRRRHKRSQSVDSKSNQTLSTRPVSAKGTALRATHRGLKATPVGPGLTRSNPSTIGSPVQVGSQNVGLTSTSSSIGVDQMIKRTRKHRRRKKKHRRRHDETSASPSTIKI